MVAAVAGSLSTNALQAADSTWFGGTGNWNVAGNWSPVGVPNSALTNVFIDGGNVVNSIVTLNTGATIGNLTIDAGDSLGIAKTPPKGAALMVVGEATIALPLEGVIDMAAERKRLEKEIAKAENDRGKAEAWLSNEANVANSPPQVLELNRERVAEGADKIKRLKAALKRIEA